MALERSEKAKKMRELRKYGKKVSMAIRKCTNLSLLNISLFKFTLPKRESDLVVLL